MMCSLTACAGNLNHYKKGEAEVLMKEERWSEDILHEYLESQISTAVGIESEE